MNYNLKRAAYERHQEKVEERLKAWCEWFDTNKEVKQNGRYKIAIQKMREARELINAM